jgi:hypothetical protein
VTRIRAGRLEILLFSTASRQGVGSPEPPVQWEPRGEGGSKAAVHFHLMPRLRTRGATSPLLNTPSCSYPLCQIQRGVRFALMNAKSHITVIWLAAIIFTRRYTATWLCRVVLYAHCSTVSSASRVSHRGPSCDSHLRHLCKVDMIMI